MKLLKNITFAIKGHEKHFASSLVLHFCHALLLSIPVVLLVAILRELLAPSTNTSTVWLLVAVMAASFVVQLFVSWYANLSNHRLSFKLSEKLRMDIGTHLYRISLGVFVKHEPSTLSSVISQDVRVVESLFSQYHQCRYQRILSHHIDGLSVLARFLLSFYTAAGYLPTVSFCLCFGSSSGMAGS